VKRRVVWLERSVSLWAWPSRGGIIALDRATALDFDFLGLDTLDPQLSRDQDQDMEARFCQRLLLLGAKWFDGRDRYGFVADFADDQEPAIQTVQNGSHPAPTKMERQWVSAGIPSNPEGDYWVAEYETPMYFVKEKHNLVPYGAFQVSLARTMDEKCEMLKRMEAKFYTNLDECNGFGCLNVWKNKTTGEFGSLVNSRD
ncbi:hypothetical protein K431DRAFT_226644, partial [Polychaeton citri CBS 116435]